MEQGFELYHPGEAPEYTMALVYGDPGTGKSRFATALPGKGKIIYVTWDSKAEALKSILPKYHDRIVVVNPKVKTSSKSTVDPVVAAFVIAKTDWKEEFPDMEYLVVDTVSAMGKAMLRHNADIGKYTKNPIQFEIGESGEKITNPTEGDYGATQDQIERIMDILGEQPFHTIIIAHAGIAKTKEGTVIGGGPVTVGQATITTFGGRFNPMVYLTRKVRQPLGKDPGGVEYMAHTEPVGIFNAKIRESKDGGNVLAKVKLESDPLHWWTEYFTNY